MIASKNVKYPTDEDEIGPTLYTYILWFELLWQNGFSSTPPHIYFGWLGCVFLNHDWNFYLDSIAFDQCLMICRRLCQYYTDILRLVWLVSEAIKRNRFGIGKQANRRKQGGMHYKEGSKLMGSYLSDVHIYGVWRVLCMSKFFVSGEFQNRLPGQFLVDGFIFANSSVDQS